MYGDLNISSCFGGRSLSSTNLTRRGFWSTPTSACPGATPMSAIPTTQPISTTRWSGCGKGTPFEPWRSVCCFRSRTLLCLGRSPCSCNFAQVGGRGGPSKRYATSQPPNTHVAFRIHPWCFLTAVDSMDSSAVQGCDTCSYHGMMLQSWIGVT